MDKDRRPLLRTAAGWPALLVIAALVIGVLFVTLGDKRSAARLKPATGSAQAMALAADADSGRR